MKTSDETKKGLECCGVRGKCHSCPYESPRTADCVGQLLTDAFAYIHQLEAQAPKWISVEERLPDRTDLNDLLVCCKDHINGHRWIQLAHLVRSNEPDEDGEVTWWMDDGYTVNTVTHWMDLPEPPKEDDHV